MYVIYNAIKCYNNSLVYNKLLFRVTVSWACTKQVAVSRTPVFSQRPTHAPIDGARETHTVTVLAEARDAQRTRHDMCHMWCVTRKKTCHRDPVGQIRMHPCSATSRGPGRGS